MNEKTQKLLYALLDYLGVQENRVLKDGLSISDTTNDVFGEPYIKELNIKLRYIDEEELNAYKDEIRMTKGRGRNEQ